MLFALHAAIASEDSWSRKLTAEQGGSAGSWTGDTDSIERINCGERKQGVMSSMQISRKVDRIAGTLQDLENASLTP